MSKALDNLKQALKYDKTTLGFSYTISAKDLEEVIKEYERLLNISKKMHTWIFLHTDNEQEVYDEIGLTVEENTFLGYSGQFILGGKNENN